MQSWNYKKCREEAEKTGALAEDSFVKIVMTRNLCVFMAALSAVLLALVILFAVLQSGKMELKTIQTHEIEEFVLSADDCIEYSIDMTDGDCVKSMLVMPSKVFTLETDIGGTTQQNVYYVYLDDLGNEGIFRFSGDLSQPVKEWLASWEAFSGDMPEPVEIFGLRGTLNIISSDEDTRKIAELYDGKSYIDVGEHLVVREVAIPGAEEAVARQEAEKKEFDERQHEYRVGMYASLVLFALAIVAMIEGNRLYNKARNAFKAEYEYND